MTSKIAASNITAVILAGGQATRMGGIDKGLVELRGKPLIEHVLAAIEPQVHTVIISANRNVAQYSHYGYQVVSDTSERFLGPLAGISAGLQQSRTPFVLVAPCDSPFPPEDLAARLRTHIGDADIAVAHDGERLQPTFSLIRRHLLPDLLDYLNGGGRKLRAWYEKHPWVAVDFSDQSAAFLNINTLPELRQMDDPDTQKPPVNTEQSNSRS